MRSITLRLQALLALVATPALAAEGVLEINQTCAVQTGCFAGDAPGFPVTIGHTGSYQLTSSLDVGVAPTPIDATAISIGADQVWLDLGGFTLQGPLSCSGGPPNSSGLGIGIVAVGSTHTTVVNGSLRGFGDAGLILESGAHAERVAVTCVGNTGITLLSGAQVVNCRADSNGQDGIRAGAGSRVTDCVARGNQGYGLVLAEGGFGSNVFSGNNGGDANDQVSIGSASFELAPNVCGDSLSCASAGVCGDGQIESGEVCDGAELGGISCTDLGFNGGTLACSASCDGFDTSSCIDPPVCGNGLLEGGEVCDGTDLGGLGCSDMGFAGGTLACLSTCDAFDTSGCFP